jgi:surface protein
MGEFVHVFQKGKMNKDLDERLVPNGEYRDALNLDLANSDNGNMGSLQSVKGNQQLRGKPQWTSDYIDSLTNAKCIGSFVDDKSDKIYWFITSTEADCIAEYNFAGGQIKPVIVDTNNVLNFSTQYLITGINIIDNLLFWTDNNSEPKTINIDKFKRGSVNFVTHTKIPDYDSTSQTYSANLTGRPDFNEADVTVIKKSPLTALTLDMAASKYGNSPGTGTSEVQFIPGGVYNPTGNNEKRINFTYAEDTASPEIRRSLPTRFQWEDNISNDPDYYDETSIEGWNGYLELEFGSPLPLNWQTGDIVNINADYEDTNFTDYEYGLSIRLVEPLNSTNIKWKCEIQSISSDIGTFIDANGNIIKFEWECLLEEDDAMFEDVFPRFAYRWKFIDNEYSTFSPFSEVAFLAGDFSYESREGYNTGMINSIRKLILKDISWGHVDVTEVDILYKESNSSAVYVVDTLVKDESYDTSGNLITEFEVKTELIGALIEGNQILRPWDNVPRKAQAQEIIGNRIVYGNYLQNYNVPTSEITLSSISNQYTVPMIVGEPTFSVKSIRTYQAGVVYLDKYGRETPVFTSKEAGTKLNISSSSTFNRLIAQPTNTPPDWATHYKIFIKENSNEYYNLALDRYYDAEDGNVWLSFPSSERNKISEESYLISKKQHDNNTPIESLSRYRVLSISNEAPDFIRTVDKNLGTEAVENISLISVGSLGFAFKGPSPSANPEFAPNFAGNSVIFALGAFKSEKYKVIDYKVVNTVGDETNYELTIGRGLGADATFLEVVGVGQNFDITVVAEQEETKPEYQGRFFVKIPRDAAFDTHIMTSFQALDPQFSILGSISFTESGTRGLVGENGTGRTGEPGYYWIDWGFKGDGAETETPTEMFVAGTGVWMNGVPYGGANPSNGPIGRRLNDIQPQRAFFQNFGPITKNNRFVGFSYVKVKQRTNGVPTYIDAMSGTVPTPFDPDIEDGRATRPVTPNGFITTGGSVRFEHTPTGELSPVYQIVKAQAFHHRRAQDDNEGDARNYAYVILLELNEDVDWEYAPDSNVYTTRLSQAADIAIQAIKPVVPQGNRLLTSNNPAIFETEPKEAVDLDLYYQASNALPISGYNDPVQLDWYNCFSFGNGVESNRIRDDYNAVTMDKGATVSSILADPYGEERRGSGYIFSQIYNSTSGINRLNQFIQALPITKDLNPIYGTIQKLHARDTDLITFCEDKCFRVLANKDALFNADGNANVTSNNNVLGQATPYAGEFGISKNPESFADYGFRLYFTDKNRGSVMRLSRDGLTQISEKGMSSFFADNLKANNKLIGSYDADKGLYNLTLNSLTSDWQTKFNPIQADNLAIACEDNIQNPPFQENYISTTVSFKESVDGWTSRKSFVPESGVSLNDRYFTFKDGLMWAHNENPIYNKFYGEQYISSFNVLINELPNSVKGYTALNYTGTKSRVLEYEKASSNKWYSIAEVNAGGWLPTSLRIKNPGWYVNYIRTNLEGGEVKEFEDKEGKYFNYIKALAVCNEAFGIGYPTGTDSGSQNYLLTTFIDLTCSNTGSTTDPDADLFLWTNWDEIIGNNDVTIANETTALSAKCIIEGFYNTLSDYTNIDKSGVEFKYFATAGLVVGTQLYDYNTEEPLTSAGLGLYVPSNLGEPNDSGLDPNNLATVLDSYDIIIYNSSGVITDIIQYNTITGSCGDAPLTNPLTFEVTTTVNSTSVELPYDASGTYSGTINWGDGNTSVNSYANRTHTYTAAGVYTIEISGRSSRIIFSNLSNSIAALYTKLVKFGSPMDFERLSFGASSSVIDGAVNMDFSTVEDVPSFIFNAHIENLTRGLSINNFNNISNWDVSNVTGMEAAFRDNTSFNQNIGSWDVSSVTATESMFHNAAAFNQNINSWDMSSAVNVTTMFYQATSFNQPLNSWNMSSVKYTSSMFRDAIAFNQPLNNWDVSNVISMSFMFAANSASSPTIFNQDISSWDVSNVTIMQRMFLHNHYFNQNINSWNTSSLTSLSWAFYDARAFNQPLNSWNTSNLNNLTSTFTDAIVFNQPLNNWDVSSVTTMYGTFNNAEAFNQPLNSWDVSSVASMESMFEDTLSFNQDINSWNVSSVTSMKKMFRAATAFNKPLYNWNTSNVTTMNSMFSSNSIFNQPLNTQSVTAGGSTYTAWDVSNVTDMNSMFSFCSAFDGNIVNWDVSSVTNMSSVFLSATAFNQDIGSWNVSSVTNMNKMFQDANSFNQNISSWNVSSVTNMERMFRGVSSFNQNLSGWNVVNVTACLNFSLLSTGWTLAKPNFTNCTP